jgi:hypothetical protein
MSRLKPTTSAASTAARRRSTPMTPVPPMPV